MVNLEFGKWEYRETEEHKDVNYEFYVPGGLIQIHYHKYGSDLVHEHTTLIIPLLKEPRPWTCAIHLRLWPPSEKRREGRSARAQKKNRI